MGINGFCGVSVVTERGTDAFADVVDKLSSRSKVDVAVKVARSIADVHEIDGPNSTVSLVHNDININNIFMGPKSNPLLNDFNIAVLMMKDRHTNSSCSFPGHFPNPQVSLSHERWSLRSLVFLCSLYSDHQPPCDVLLVFPLYNHSGNLPRSKLDPMACT